MLTLLTRTGDSAMNTSAMLDMTKTSSIIQDSARKVNTGRAMESYQDSKEYAVRILDLETQLAGYEDYEQGETTIKTRLDKMELVLRQLNEISTDYRARLTRATSFGVEDNAFQGYCAIQLQEVQRLLNTQDAEGRYLFAGENTNTAPVDVSLVAPLSLNSPVSTAYYLGTSTAPSGLIGDDQVITYGVTGDNDGFAQLINALVVGAANAPSNDPNSGQYQMLSQMAMPMMALASSELPDVLHAIGNTMKVVEQSAERQNTIMLYTKELLSKMTDADPIDSMYELHRSSMCLKYSMSAHQIILESVDDLLTAMRR